MKAPQYILIAGTPIITNAQLESTEGMFVVARHLDARKTNILGTIKGYVPGHGGDVYYVEHEPGDVAVYCYTEFEYAQKVNE